MSIGPIGTEIKTQKIYKAVVQSILLYSAI